MTLGHGQCDTRIVHSLLLLADVWIRNQELVGYIMLEQSLLSRLHLLTSHSWTLQTIYRTFGWQSKLGESKMSLKLVDLDITGFFPDFI